jgi:hypothetical protein
LRGRIKGAIDAPRQLDIAKSSNGDNQPEIQPRLLILIVGLNASRLLLYTLGSEMRLATPRTLQ